jgi:uncharacterized protein with FMN-binding domain
MIKMKNKTILFKSILLLITTLVISCGDNKKSNTSNQSKASENATQSEDAAENKTQEVSIDGVYTGSQNISGLNLEAKLTISGKSWSATSQLGYDNPEYQNGVVNGTDLYDDSGMIKIGYVSGNNASIDGYPSMRK